MAGVTLGFLKYVLGLDTLQYKKGMSEAERDLVTFGKKMQKVGSTMSSIGKGMTVFATLPVAAFATSSFKIASDAAELQGSFDQTFKGMTREMNAWAVATGDAMGRSTREMQAAANTFGIFFNTAVPKGKAAEMSQTFAKLAQDLGSFYNVDTDTAIEKLRSGLAGESEPLRAFGVFLTEATVKAKAMELGLTGANGALSEQAKIAARAALILEQTTNAQGDVARTSSGTANQMRAAAAAFEELQIIVGTKLLPVITPLITKLAEALSWFTSLPVPVQNTALAVIAVSAALGPVLIAFGSLISILGTVGPAVTVVSTAFGVLNTVFLAARISAVALLPALTPFLVPIAAIAAAVTAAYLAWKNWDKIVAIVRALYAGVKTWLQDRLGPVFDWVKGKLEAVGGWFYRLYDRVVGHSYIPDMVTEIGQHMARLDAVMVQPAKAATDAAAEAFRGLQQRVQGLLEALFPEAAAQNQLNRDIADLKAYAEAAKLPVDQLNEALRRLQERFDAQRGQSTNVFGQTADEASQSLLASLAPIETIKTGLDAIVEKTNRWQDVLGGVANDLAGIVGNFLSDAVEGTAKLKDLWKEVLGYAIRALTSQNGPLQQLFGGGMQARAAGGPVLSGTPYLVGEKGPEIFVPRAGGRILSNRDSVRALGGMSGGATVNMTVYTPDADSFRRSDRQTTRSLGRRLAAVR